MSKPPSPTTGDPAQNVREVARSARGDVQTGPTGATPKWLWGALLAGAVITIWWAWFVSGFMSEPSAVGRVRVALLTSICLSALAGLAGAGAALGLLRREPWGRPLAWIGAITLTLSGAGAIGGIPALVGLLWSRKPLTP